MADPSKYHVRVTAGPSYDPASHQIVHVNTSNPTSITSSAISSSVSVRIQNYRGLPTDSPSTCAYFSDPIHKADLYSIAFSFKLTKDINGADLQFGNDFDKPIKDRLPPGFNAALRCVRWAIDPGLDGDVYAEKPFLYGPLLSSINVFRVGEEDKKGDVAAADDVIHEGADGESGKEIRKNAGVPADGQKRMKHFLDEKHRKAWIFEAGREYSCDFYNPYLDFNDLALKLPVVTLHLMRFWDGQPLRYVLKHKNAEVDDPLIVIVFTLIPEEELEKEEEKLKADNTAEAGKENVTAKPNEETKESIKFEDEDVD